MGFGDRLRSPLLFGARGLCSLSPKLPELEGRPIRVRFQPDLHVCRGKLRSGGSFGRAVHAATFVRQREIVLDAALVGDASELFRILLHELHHFAWCRQGNPARRSYEELLRSEFEGGVPGELGWSAELAKQHLTDEDRRRRTRRWREYVCESFCDTGAWIRTRPKRHEEHTLPSARRILRLRWFERNRLSGPLSV